MSLSKLPNEVIFLIATHLACYRDLRALVLSSRGLFHLVKGYLRKHSYQACHGDALCCAAAHGDEGLAMERLKRMALAAESFPGPRVRNPYKHPLCTTNWRVEDTVLIQRALLVAVQAGSKRVVNLLLDHGAQTIFRCPAGYTNNIPPLYLAVQNGHEDLVDLLCGRGDSCYGLNTCPLLWAIEHNQRRIIRTLLRHGSCGHCWYVLPMAMNRRDTDLLHFLLVNGLHGTYYAGDALFAAISKGSLEMVRLFIAHGADPNRLGDCYDSRWEKNHVQLLQKIDSRSLLEPGDMEDNFLSWCNGLCVEEEPMYCSTTYVAIYYDQMEILRFLLEYGVHPETDDIQLAQKKGNQEAVSLLSRFSYEDVPQKKSYRHG
ncbi:ankyrin repeat and SOCS box protein 3 [Aspergillus udagawae]|uniref:Ankyrin repeat and SOCS box protein 3 n=1 Tax=Aspergillus udagawae TaxID=91492 RepID=A0A8H3N3A3_9EURO|nr:ankyrin repeat and SOCS box protein 3 [Aspergillus udagawae]